MTLKLSHRDLVKIATKWLAGSQRCGVVTWEHSGDAGETPDAIGWRLGARLSYLIECKTSRADFLADRDKTARRFPAHGVGRYRFYLCPEEVLTPDDMPPGWGLLWTQGWRVSKRREAECFNEYNISHEMAIMYHAFRRHRANVKAINDFFTQAFPLRGELPDGDTETEDSPRGENQEHTP